MQIFQPGAEISDHILAGFLKQTGIDGPALQLLVQVGGNGLSRLLDKGLIVSHGRLTGGDVNLSAFSSIPTESNNAVF